MNPLTLIETDDGCLHPVMFDRVDDELSGRDLRLIARSHGYELKSTTTELFEREAYDQGDYQAVVKSIPSEELTEEGWALVGVWETEDEPVVLLFARPIPDPTRYRRVEG